MTAEEIKQLAAEVAAQLSYTVKEMLTTDEAAALLGLSKSYVYKLVNRRELPYYKPVGGKVYFSRADLTEWMQRGRYESSEEIDVRVDEYMRKYPRRTAAPARSGRHARGA
ncbi:MAG: helix-turn-helix domain-containing protein [Muribaculaceae bacterium]|nr:helix-turn-helix domain-containing protein [Muribaculaceae bacterium]